MNKKVLLVFFTLTSLTSGKQVLATESTGVCQSTFKVKVNRIGTNTPKHFTTHTFGHSY